MDNLSSLIKNKIDVKKNKNIHSEVHYWTDVISSAFGERKKFAMYLGIIKKIGVSQARQIFAEIKDSNVSSPGKLFFWKAKQVNNKDKEVKNKE
ncbi:MAG: hypothetical protein US58_C0004G0015 [Candidatus Magasanikbacteria bacterium GW2011_GWA2_37_8]|uniref:Uncharacterized protein n=1 Tax=Candidatus Magasanikbacteria bacterium GW2011_GWA2_37_8 TaxID=1619036 RepID=A0A0G0HDE1_9BACT|nr:MAG: hypothetical protein US58_C0004G0015 [Candidatus Magasanikbacteria bacterium GW2011_GWA2_37_8]